MKPLITLLLACGLWAAEAPKPVVLTDAERFTIQTLRLRLAQAETAQAQMELLKKQIEELAPKETGAALQKVLSDLQAKGCYVQKDITCGAAQ